MTSDFVNPDAESYDKPGKTREKPLKLAKKNLLGILPWPKDENIEHSQMIQTAFQLV